MKKTVPLFVLVASVTLFVYFMYLMTQSTPTPTVSTAPRITPISHASLVIGWDTANIYVDPIGALEQYANAGSPTIILVTDIHGDHLSTSTLSALMGENTVLIAPEAVRDLLPEALAARTRVLHNGESGSVGTLLIEAVPMYNLPDADNKDRHTKGRGNGYILERGDTRIYIAGDTAGTSEMRALTNIAIAFIPMNLPYTMGVEEAADAVLAFKPRQVYPYHYRSPDGLADVAKFKQLVNAGNPSIEVILAKWYE